MRRTLILTGVFSICYLICAYTVMHLRDTKSRAWLKSESELSLDSQYAVADHTLRVLAFPLVSIRHELRLRTGVMYRPDHWRLVIELGNALLWGGTLALLLHVCTRRMQRGVVPGMLAVWIICAIVFWYIHHANATYNSELWARNDELRFRMVGDLRARILRPGLSKAAVMQELGEPSYELSSRKELVYHIRPDIPSGGSDSLVVRFNKEGSLIATEVRLMRDY